MPDGQPRRLTGDALVTARLMLTVECELAEMDPLNVEDHDRQIRRVTNLIRLIGESDA